MDREHERRVSQLAALFGSDTNGHLRTNRNLTELWSQFDSRRRGALDQSEFTACLEFMASRSSAADAYISKDDAAQLWRRLDQHDDASKIGVVSVPSLVVFVRSALMAQWSQHRGTVDGTSPGEPLASTTSTPERRATSSDRRRRRLSSSPAKRTTGTGKPSTPRSTASASATSKQRTVSPSRSRHSSSVSPARTPRTHRPPSPGGVGLYDVLRRARVRAAFEADSIEVGYLEPGERVEVIESRNTRDGDKRVKVLFERGVVDWTGQRRVGWTSLVTPSGSILLLPVNGKIYRPSVDTSVSNSRNDSVRRFSSGGLDLSAISAEARVPGWVKRLTATPSSGRSAGARRPSSVPHRRSSASVRPRSGSRSTRTRSRSPSPLRSPGRPDDTILQAEKLIQQLSPQRDSLHQSSATTSKAGGSSRHRSPSTRYNSDGAAALASANANLAVTVARTQNPELAAGLAQAEIMIEDVRMDCARRVAEAEASRQTAEDEAAQLRRALRNAVDELQRTVTERNANETRDALADDALQDINLKLAAVQKENEQLRVQAAARPPVDLCGLWRANGIDADGQEIDESFVLRDPAEYFAVEDVLVKDSLDISGGESGKQLKRNDNEPSVVLSFCQRYEDPGAMPTRWQARLEPPGMVGWWFTDADDDGMQDEDENGGTFTATRESSPGQLLPQATTEATRAVNAAKEEAKAAASAAKVYLGEAEEACAALAAAEDSTESLKKQVALTENRLIAAVQTAESLERDVATRAERIAELEEKLRAEIVAGEDRAQSYRDDLEAAASRVDSLAAALSEAQSIANTNGLTADSSPARNPVDLRSKEPAAAFSVPQSPSCGNTVATSAASKKTKEQLYAEATARVAQELATHRQKWSKT